MICSSVPVRAAGLARALRAPSACDSRGQLPRPLEAEHAHVGPLAVALVRCPAACRARPRRPSRRGCRRRSGTGRPAPRRSGRRDVSQVRRHPSSSRTQSTDARDQPAGLQLVEAAQRRRRRARRRAGDVEVLAADHPADARPRRPARAAPRARAPARPAWRVERRAGSASANRPSPARIATPRRTPCGRSAGRGAGRRRPSPAGRRGSASRCGSSRARRRAAAPSSGSRRAPRAVASASTGRIRLPPREQRVAHRLLEAVGGRARRGEARASSR